MSMDGVLRLYFGESNLPTPKFIVDAAVQALAGRPHLLLGERGPALVAPRDRRQYERLHGVELDPAREIVITASGVQALHLAIRSVVDPGDEVVILSPAWPNSTSIVALCHGVRSMSRCARRRALSDRLRRPRGRPDAADAAIVLTSPSNPLGWVADVEEQRRLLDLCRERGLWLFADEVYERIYYAGGRSASPRRRSCASASATTLCTSSSRFRRPTA